METNSTGRVDEPTAAGHDESGGAPKLGHPRFRALLHRRGLWLIGALLLAGAAVLGYRWAFGKTKVLYATAAVERGDVESTVVAAGIVQPFKYVDVGAQTSGMLKSLKVKRGDQVEQNQLLAEIDPVLAETALTSADATLGNMTSQRSVKQAELALAKVQRTRNDELYARRLISASDRDVTKANDDAAVAEVASLSSQMKQASAALRALLEGSRLHHAAGPGAGAGRLRPALRPPGPRREPRRDRLRRRDVVGRELNAVTDNPLIMRPRRATSSPAATSTASPSPSPWTSSASPSPSSRASRSAASSASSTRASRTACPPSSRRAAASTPAS